MAFSDMLKNAKKDAKIQTESIASPSIMTLALENGADIIAAYSGEENVIEEEVVEDEWVLNLEYRTTESFEIGKKYTDENYSVVDEKKNVHLDPSQINLTQESNSQYVTFIMPRYFDGIDLMDMVISIYFINADGGEGFSDVINMYYNSTQIKFGWVLSETATALKGKLQFEIHATGVDPLGRKYLLKTRPNSQMEVLESLHGNGKIIYDETWATTFLNQINSYVTKAEKAALKTEQNLADIKDIVEEAEANLTGYSKGEINELLTTKADVSTVETMQTTINYMTDSILAINNVETGILAKSKSYTDEQTAIVEEEVNKVKDYIGTIPPWSSASTIVRYVQDELLNYYDKEKVDELFETFDISSQLTGIEGRVGNLEKEFENFDGLAALNIEFNEETKTISFYNGEEKIKDIVLNISSEEDIANALKPIEEDLQGIHEAIDDLPNTLATDYYNKTATDELLALKANKTDLDSITSAVGTNTTNIGTLSEKVVELSDEVSGIDKSPRLIYDISYEEDKLSILEGTSEDAMSPKTTVTITGGSGGTGTSSSLKIGYITKTPYVVTVDDKALITFTFSGTDSSGDAVLEGQATWSVGGTVVATSVVSEGENTFDITKYLTVGSQKVKLSVTDDAGSLVTKSWTVQKIDVRLESGFNDTFTYPLGNISFSYTPYGAVEKDIHFVLDGKEIGKVTTSSSGIPMAYTLPSQTHGSHLLEVYMTAEVNGNTLGIEEIVDEESGEIIGYNHTIKIIKDIIWYDADTGIPVIGCTQQEFTATQYATTNIVYTVYDPSTETPEVVIAVDGDIVSTKTLEKNTDTYAFRSDKVGSHVITITCGETVKTINVTITELGIKIEPVTAGLVFDFNPVGKSNNDADRLWTYSGDNGTYAMTVSNNFDWVNGGYQLDENGEQYFCIKAGTSAVIDYKMFADDAKKTGKECKLIFKTTNVAIDNAKFLSCIDDTTGSDFIGVEMFTRKACIYGGVTEYLTLPCVPDKIIELEFNISNNLEAITEICGYENGVSSNHRVYDDSYNFTQNTPKNITLGSVDCDLHIYRFKTYNTSLSARNVLTNFIADARSADEMLNRYYRNQIYNENSALVAEFLADARKDLRVIKIESPYFTKKKDDKVGNTTVTYIHKGGDPVLDNWVATDVVHSGQGTSSDNYGGAARNLDLILKEYKDYGNSPTITLGDGKTTVSKVSLTRDSIPVNYFNCKVNVASSNMSTNPIMAKRYNRFNPYKRPFVREKESEIAMIKDTMDFYNGVIFIKESDPDVNTHREFADCDWHFYAMCNIGDSKKTDKTRLTDPDDKYECIVEIMDVKLPLSDFPKNTMVNAMGYKTDEKTQEKIYTWAKDENLGILHELIDGEYVLTEDTTIDFDKTYYVDVLEHDDFSEDFTYGWRYLWEDGTDEENEEVFDYCKQKWIDFYRFVTNSTDEEFKAHLSDYVVVDSALYYYLFTTRYTLVDNRAKNSFWHYGWTGEYDESGEKIRKWDLSFAYDMDTALGLNNYGDLVYRYGYEDTDIMDGTTNTEVFRESDSTFFCRLRDLFADRAKTMFNTLESQGAWSSVTLLKEIKEWQSQFPEALWLEHIQKLYIDSYTSTFINGEGDQQFLRNMAHGKCESAFEDFEVNQEKYMASKFQSALAASDQMVIRCAEVADNLVIQPNYKLKLTPYAYMYLNVKYGTQSPIQVKGYPGVECEIPYEGDTVDIIDIYSASNIQSVGDLSYCYPATVDTSKGHRLKELIIGNDTEGYDNPGLTTITLGANKLLEVLNIENVSGITQSLNLSELNNLRELYAHGTNIGGVTFANGGEIEIAELPAINSMTMRNLLYLTNIDIVSLDKLTSITIENCDTVDVKTMLESAPNLNRIRITGIDWELSNGEFGAEDEKEIPMLNRLYEMGGFDKNGYNTEKSVLSGKVHVPVIRQKRLEDYQKAWSDLEITYDTLIEQFTVTFVNADEDNTVLEIQYIDKGEDAIDPTTREDNPLSPTIKSTVSHDFTFTGWNTSLLDIFSDRIIKAVYSPSLRKYKIKYISKGTVMEGYPKEGYYGDNIVYTGNIPTYTNEETGYKYYLFNRWDKSGFLTGDFDENGVKTVNAIYDSFEYKDGSFTGKELEDLSPVEIYAMNKLEMYRDVVTDKDEYSFELGHDFTYDDVESIELIGKNSPLGDEYKNIVTFDASKRKYLDTGIKLFNADRDFVLAIDYRFIEGIQESVLAQCFQRNGNVGFQLRYNNRAQIKWGTNTSDTTLLKEREMVVIRHKKGDTNLYVYTSNLNGDAVQTISLSSKEFSSESTLVFGCEKLTSTNFDYYSSGEIYWSKLWYADLGEDVCKQLATWTHEKITLEACGFNRYYLSDNPDAMCSFSLLSNHLLSKKHRWNTINTNAGGWAESKLNQFLNTRLYDAIPTQVKLLLKQVQMISAVGYNSSEISSSDCYIAVPALREVNPKTNQEPYNSEGYPISYFNQAEVSPKRAFADGTYYAYWLRTPNVGYPSYVHKVEADGKIQPITNATDELGLTILLSF